MTKRERVTAAFQGREPDHVPVCMWKHVPRAYWADDDRFVQCQVDSYRATDVDFMKLSGDKYFAWPAPALLELRTAKDLYRMEPLGMLNPHLRGQLERTRKVVRALNGECPALYLIFAPLSCLRLQIGYPRMMELIREDPEAMKYACNVIAQDLNSLIRALIEDAGVDGIFYSVQNGEENRFTAEEYRDWVTPSDLAVLNYANSLSDMNAIHFCAWEGDRNRLSVWKDYKAPVVSWSRYIDLMDIKEAQAFFGCTVWGGFDNRSGSLLYTGTREEIEAETASLIAQAGKTGYILGSDCSLHDELDQERIRWVAEASRRI